MIFNIDDSITKTEDGTVIRDMAQALVRAAEKQHHVCPTPDVWKWIDENILQTDTYLGSLEKELLMSNRELWDPKSMKRNHETTVHVGISGNMHTVRDMLKLIDEPSIIVVENETYDGAAITKWVKLYKKKKGLETINTEVYQALRGYRLRFHNAGGGNMTIANSIDTKKVTYGHLYPFLITTIFDSDKRSASDTTDHNSKLKAYLTANTIAWHELKKREIENYFAPSTYSRAGLLRDERQANAMPPEEWDFHDMGKSTIVGKTDDNGKAVHIEKKDVLTLSDLLTRDELEGRVQTDSTYDEIQEIIFLLAKYI